jgi:fucose 4-O-acetylase-like acetyltransferase
MKRDTTISICKAIAIILMVMGHAECPQAISTFIYEFHMPVFFITAGYFFSLKYIDDEAVFVKKRLKGLYIPFVKWSVFFLIIHNWMFDIGLLNEKYGNITGGVTHPYSFHQAQQNLWNIITAMGSYDQFLCGTFWFFRGLLVGSIVYLIVFKLLDNLLRKTKRNADFRTLAIPIAVCLIMLLIGAWKTGEGLKIVNLIQGGYREIMGTFFFGCGFLFRQLQQHYRVSLWSTLLCFGVVLLFARLSPACLDWRPSFRQFISFPLPAVCGFLMIYNVSSWLNRHNGIVKRFLVYCGNNTLYIFIFHIVSFKLVSIIKIVYYGLDYQQIGCHLVIHDHAKEDLFWILYTIAGVGVPLAWNYAYRKLKEQAKSIIS